MRTSLLILFLLGTAMAATAQTLVADIDTSYTTNTNTGASNSLYTVGQSTHDSACRTNSHTFTYFDAITHKPTRSVRDSFSYYPDGSYYQILYQSGDTARTSFVNSSLSTYTYIASGLYDTIRQETWNGTRWVPYALTVYDYNTVGDELQELDQTWSNYHNAYINSNRYLFDYDENGNETFFASESWDTTRTLWITNYEYDRTYDTSNNQLDETDKFHNYAADTLETYSHTTYYNNSSGNADSLLTVFLEDNSYRKSYLTYYPNSDHYRYRYDYTYYPDSTLSYSDLYDHVFDTTGSRYLDSTTISFRNAGEPNYSLAFSSFADIEANADSTRRTYQYGYRNYNSDGSSTVNFLTSSIFYYVPCTPALPVTLLSFTAVKKDNNAVLQWKTANETNTAFFNIQRSTDGIHFTTIGTVKAAGSSSAERSYTYTDVSISQWGTNKLYYRLAQRDIDGTIHNSRIAQIDITGGKLSITLSPNPVRNTIGISSSVSITNAVIRIADVTGKTIYTSRANLFAGTRFTIDASAFARGVYFITVQGGTDKMVVKLVKE